MFDRTKYLNEGAEAGLDGQPIECCPYAPNSLEYDLWIDGWRCADDGTFALSVSPNWIIDSRQAEAA
jgi:ribosome modulation factor